MRKKITGIITAITAALLCAVICMLPAGAYSYKTLKSGTLYSDKLDKNGSYIDGQFEVAKSGNVTININGLTEYVEVTVSNSKGIAEYPTSATAGPGTVYSNGTTTKFYWTPESQNISARLDYKLEPGTYYLNIRRSSSLGEAGLTYKVTTPKAAASNVKNNTSKTQSTGTVLVVYLKPKATLKLGALTDGKTVLSEWSTSDSKVVSISKNVATAAGEGTAVITGKIGKETVTLTIIVQK